MLLLHISVLSVALWDMEQAHSGICELGQLTADKTETPLGLYVVQGPAYIPLSTIYWPTLSFGFHSLCHCYLV